MVVQGSSPQNWASADEHTSAPQQCVYCCDFNSFLFPHPNTSAVGGDCRQLPPQPKLLARTCSNICSDTVSLPQHILFFHKKRAEAQASLCRQAHDLQPAAVHIFTTLSLPALLCDNCWSHHRQPRKSWHTPWLMAAHLSRTATHTPYMHPCHVGTLVTKRALHAQWSSTQCPLTPDQRPLHP